MKSVRTVPVLLLHQETFGGMGRAATFLKESCRCQGRDFNELTLTTPEREEVDQGQLTIVALAHFARLIFRYCGIIVAHRPSGVYIPIAQSGLPLLRDLLLIALANMARVQTRIHLHGSQLVDLISGSTPRARLVRRLTKKSRWAVLSERLRAILLDAGFAAGQVFTLRNPAFPSDAIAPRHKSNELLTVGFL